MKIQTMFDHAPVLLFYKDKKNKFIRVNAQTADLWNITPKDMEGKTLYDFIPEDEAVYIHENELQVIRSGKPKKNMLGALTIDGKSRWFRVDIVPYKDKNKIIGTIGFALDVTEQRAIYRELELARKAMEQATSTIVMTDKNGNITFVNNKFSNVTGYSYKEVIGKNPRILKSGKMDKTRYKDLWETLSRGESWRGEFINKTKDGELYWELATISPVHDNNGEVTHYVKVAEVLSEIKNSVLNMWNVLEYANYYVVIFDKELKIILCNQIFARVLGFKETLEVVGTSFTDYISEDDAYIFKSMQVHISNPTNDMTEFLSELVDPNGGKHMVKWFNSWINSETSWTFCFGVPIKDDVFYNESIDAMRERYKDIISVHRTIIHELKEKNHTAQSEKKT